MSYEVKPLAMYGLQFKTQEQVHSFFKQNGFEEVYDVHDKDLEQECLNAWMGEGYVVGFKMSLGETFDKYQQKWQKIFPQSKLIPQGILEVVHF